MSDQDLYTRVHELLTYQDGRLYWKISRRGATKGVRAGCVNNKTFYRQIMIDRVTQLEHRIVFLMHNGKMPNVIDHINSIRDDNRIENLRDATCQTNQYNRGVSVANKIKLKGVIFEKSRSKFRADIRINGNGTTIGRFKTKEEAHEAYKQAALKYHGEFARF